MLRVTFTSPTHVGQPDTVMPATGVTVGSFGIVINVDGGRPQIVAETVVLAGTTYFVITTHETGREPVDIRYQDIRIEEVP
jgi:hypothetical protein